MLRTVLKILLAVTLLAQGGFGALAASTARAHAHCHHGMQHDAHARTPCCPDCDMPDDMAACSACAAAVIATSLPAPWRFERATVGPHEIAVPMFSIGEIPPTRPPIV